MKISFDINHSTKTNTPKFLAQKRRVGQTVNLLDLVDLSGSTGILGEEVAWFSVDGMERWSESDRAKSFREKKM